MEDRKVSYGIEQTNVGQSSSIWYREVSYWTGSFMWDRYSLIWEREILGQSRPFQDNAVHCETSGVFEIFQENIQKLARLCRASTTSEKLSRTFKERYFREILRSRKYSGRSKIIFLMFEMSQKFTEALKVLECVASFKIFSMIFKRLLDYQKVQDDFPEVRQDLKYLSSFKIFFDDF